MNVRIYWYIAVMALVTYLIRALPLTLIRREIKNPTMRSFLYYIPYVTLSVMTFPAMLAATDSMVSGAAAFLFAIWIALRGGGLFRVSMGACALVFIIECFL